MRADAPPRRVLMTGDAVGGVWEYALELAGGLAHHGIRVTLATMGPRPDAAQRRRTLGIEGLDLVEGDFALEWMPDPWGDVGRAGCWLQDLAARTGAEVVHVNGYAHAALDWEVPVVTVAHSCVWSWHHAVRGAEPGREWERYRAAVRAGLAGASAVVAPTRWMLRALATHYGPVPHGVVIPNGRAGVTPVTREREPVVFAAGRLWDPAKNVAALDTIASELPWPVAVAGDAAAAGKACPPLRSVRWLGRLGPEAMRAWCSCAAIYALPAGYEPFGLSVLEAAAGGCALVLGDIPSLRENWDGAAVFVPAGDTQQLAQAIRALIDTPERRGELGRRAAARARELTPARMTQGYVRLYGSLLAGGAAQLTETRQSCAS